MDIRCKICGRTPDQISEYVDRYKSEGYESPEDFVQMEEGTYNWETGKFYCTDCYIMIGMPLGKA